jgi:hypothetical protein
VNGPIQPAQLKRPQQIDIRGRTRNFAMQKIRGNAATWITFSSGNAAARRIGRFERRRRRDPTSDSVFDAWRGRLA